MHADFCSRPTLNVNVDFIGLFVFDCINFLHKIFGSGYMSGLLPRPPGESTTRRKEKRGLTEGERWP